jgi:1,4-dihydroxy-2-naphthoyl-CoA synthase
MLFSAAVFVGSCCFALACKQASQNIEGFAPMYASAATVHTIDVLPPQNFVNAGKIVQFVNTTYQVDAGKGVHIIDCTNKLAPAKAKFIAIPGVTDIAFKDGMLMANNYDQLVSLNISDLNNIVVAKRLENVFPGAAMRIPSQPNVFFECIDSTKGIVVGWETKLLKDPKCRTL